MNSEERYSPALYRIALLTAIATFPLIFMGGLVTSHGAGMSVPDWPNSFGYNMFTFPPSQWVGGIFYEHTHRLMGTVVGLLSIVLTVFAWKLEHRRWARWLATSMLVAVILQGALGGLRVIWVNLDLAIVHAIFAQTCFALAASIVVVTSRWWIAQSAEAMPHPRANILMRLAAACVFAVFIQLVLGAIMRHEKAGLAIPDLPLAYGQVLPPISSDGLGHINQRRAWSDQLDPVTLTQVWLHFSHRIGAVIVSVLTIALTTVVLRAFRQNRALVRPTIALIHLLAAQITLVVLTVLWRKPADIASAHVAVGALILITNTIIALRALRLYSPRLRTASIARESHDRAPQGFELSPA